MSLDKALARSLVENHPSFPRRFYRAHMFWLWIWFLSGLVSFGLIPLALGLGKAISQSACEFVIEFAEESSAFYDELVRKGWIDLEILE